MDFDWNKALESLTGAWSNIEQSKANLQMARLDARYTGTNDGRLVKDGTMPTAVQQAMPWLLVGGGLLLVYVLVKK